jgi:hypothetical protein
MILIWFDIDLIFYGDTLAKQETYSIQCRHISVKPYNWPGDVSAVIIREATFIYLYVYHQPFRS